MKKGVVAHAIKQNLVSAKDNTLLVLSEASCVVEKTAYDSTIVQDDLLKEISDSNSLIFVAGIVTASYLFVSALPKKLTKPSQIEQEVYPLVPVNHFSQNTPVPLSFIRVISSLC